MSKAYNRSTGYRKRKRRFTGNRYTTKSEICNQTSEKTASAKKIKPNLDVDQDSFVESGFLGYRILDLSILSRNIHEFLACKVCGGDISLNETCIAGLSSTFELRCSNCDIIGKFPNSKHSGVRKNIPEINKRVTYAMRCIGQGLGGLKTFCCVMDLPPPVTQKAYDNIVDRVRQSTSIVAKMSMEKAVLEEIKENSGKTDITISGDGTWKRRGHTSKIGVCSIIGGMTGKVLDVEVLSTFCKTCDSADTEAKDHDCLRNHSGSSGQMETVGMVRIFQRSENCNGVRYTNYIGDGDSSTYKNIVEFAPYGSGATIDKIECVGHVQKRMGAALRKLKANTKGKLADGKTIGGKGRLTDKLIDKLTVFYGNAIRSNKNSVKDMRKAIWAVYCHIASTDKEPLHLFCPTGKESWCKYQKFVANKQKGKFVHKKPLPPEVMKKVKTVFARLSEPSLLKKCLGGKTQNANEAFNSVIWKFCPKTSGSGRKIVDISANEAIISFNEGSTGRLQTLSQLGFAIGQYSVTAMRKADERRLKMAEIKADMCSLEARRAKRRQKKKEEEAFLLQEGISYASGQF